MKRFNILIARSLSKLQSKRLSLMLLLVSGQVTVSANAAAPDADAVVSIKGGTFVMGTAAADIPALKTRYELESPGIFENEMPAHEVTVSDFRIDRFEITNSRFNTFLAANPRWLPENVMPASHNGRYLESWNAGRFPQGQAEHPVVFITWHAAQAFCRRSGGRLPTEAEWEYVARAGDEREFPWGNELPATDRANYGASGIDATVAVGSYPPNEFGVHDLAGNVWEFLYDTWTEEYAAAARVDPVSGGLIADENTLQVSGRRAVRGASFGGSVVNLRTRWRDSHIVTNAIGFVGFRCAYPM